MLVGPRHFDGTMVAQYERYFKEGEAPEESESVQGFIDQWGVFMDRFEALAVATAANQVLVKTYPSNQLFSEDLY